MIKKLLVLMWLITTTSCYAVESYNATILYSHSWITGGDTNKGITIISGQLDENRPILYAKTSASAYNSSGVVNENIFNKAAHSYRINNYSRNKQTYRINISLCADSRHCFRNSTSVSIEPNGYYYSSANSSITCAFYNPGNYTLEARTEVSGDSSSYARDSANIYVSKR